MMTQLKKLIRDILYVSKLTKTNNKKVIITIAVVLSQLTALIDIVIIVLFATFITDSAYDNPLLVSLVDYVLIYKFLFPILVLLRFLFIYLHSMSLKNLELSIQKNLKVYLVNEVFEKRNYSVADAYFYINILSGHVSFFYSNVAGFLNSLLQIVAYSIYLFLSDSSTILTFGLGALVLFYPTKFLIKKSKEFMHETYIFGKIANEEVQRIVDNMFLIKILKKDEEEIERFGKTIEKHNFNEYSNHKFGTVNAFLPTLITMLIFSILIITGDFAKSISLDFIGVTLRLFQSLGSLANSFNKIINSHVHIEKFYEMDKNKILVNKTNFETRNDKSQNAIEVENLHFKYFNSEEFIFENLNLKIKKNSHNILTGPNGSGKSTLLGLVSGVFYSQEGKVISYSQNFGYIGAVPLIFSASLKENILYGNSKKINDEEILRFLKDFDTFKEESSYDIYRQIDNKSLSSGQMQKIAFVRALLSDLEILLLDESTANLDDHSRDYIFKILRSKNVTILNSTHDPEKFLDVDSHFHIEIENEKRKIIQKI
ncbi:ABC transporter ATP-binding protein/permease [Acidimicrobiia bacterium]|jgi:ABC-type multidrug transport system fused ATPase/permease subunit|nr:ABC transporter ATP-binding protein/permease [Acidimicrobiia bacterium]